MMPRLFSQTFLALQTKISNLKFYSSALHVSTIRPWSRAAFYWTEFTFTSHEVKVNFVSKLDINQKSESKDPHWQSISSELFEKTPAPQGLVFPLLVLSLLTLPNQNHSPPPSLSPTILSFLCSSSVPSTFFLSCRCPPGYPQPPPNEEGGVAPANLAAFIWHIITFTLIIDWIMNLSSALHKVVLLNLSWYIHYTVFLIITREVLI